MQSFPSLTSSGVSHRSGPLLRNLLGDLRRVLPPNAEIVLTINVPESEDFLAGFADLPLTILRNDVQRGFGDNHNRAFAASRGELFIIVNPDIRLPESPFEALAASTGDRVGAVAPVVRSPAGGVEDSVRRFPTIARLLSRVLLRRRTADYQVSGTEPRPIDWSAGMFVAFDRDAFASIGGFDTRYFMYMEDADICRRLWRGGWRVLLVPTASVVHDAQRASRRSAQHLRWHLRSALRFLVGI
jgi:GT2 family glycosyltransferase